MSNRLTALIVDLLRRKEENAALNRGGPTVGAGPLNAAALAHAAPPIANDPTSLMEGRKAQIAAAMAKMGE